MTSAESTPRPPWVSVSDLAEYAYCPRAQWYRTHPPSAPPDREALRSAAWGRQWHERRLSATAERERRGARWGLAALAAGGVLVLALVTLGLG